MKPKVYIETSVVSYLTAWPRRDLIVAAHQALTIEWWQWRLPRYQPIVSQFVLDEAMLGDAAAARDRLDALADIPLVTAPAAEIERVALALVARRAMPAKARQSPLRCIARRDLRLCRIGISGNMELQTSGECQPAWAGGAGVPRLRV